MCLETDLGYIKEVLRNMYTFPELWSEESANEQEKNSEVQYLERCWAAMNGCQESGCLCGASILIELSAGLLVSFFCLFLSRLAESHGKSAPAGLVLAG